jgi:hypothetical protein
MVMIKIHYLIISLFYYAELISLSCRPSLLYSKNQLNIFLIFFSYEFLIDKLILIYFRLYSQFLLISNVYFFMLTQLHKMKFKL